MIYLLTELRKIFSFSLIWIFIVLSISFNFMLIFLDATDSHTFNNLSKALEITGHSIDESFTIKLENVPTGNTKEILEEGLNTSKNIFLDYDSKVLSDFYGKVLKDSPLARKLMEKKYDLLQSSINRLSNTNAAMDFYAGPFTHYIHQMLFGKIIKAIVMESMIVALLSALYIMGYERFYNTENALMTSRIGRRIINWKFIAAIISGLTFYFIIAFITLAGFFSKWNFSGLWNSNVSSQFNYIRDMLFVRPFITWGNFSVLTYFLSVITLGGGLVVILTLFASIGNLITGNTYKSALILVTLIISGMGIQSVLADLEFWTGYFIFTFSPFSIWLSLNGWFTELGISAFIPWHETVGVVSNILFFGLGTLISKRFFYRRDL